MAEKETKTSTAKKTTTAKSAAKTTTKKATTTTKAAPKTSTKTTAKTTPKKTTTTKSAPKKTTTKKIVEEPKVESKKEEINNDTISGLGVRNEAILVYLIPLFGFIFALMKDRKVSKEARFNATQAGTIWIVSMIVSVSVGFGAYVVEPLKFVNYPISVVLLVFRIIALVKAYNGERYEIPVIVDISKSIWGEEE